MSKKSSISAHSFNRKYSGMSSRQLLRITFILLFSFNLVIEALFPVGTMATVAASSAPQAASTASSQSDNTLSQTSESFATSQALQAQQNQKQKVALAYDNAPISFEVNQGQTDAKAKFVGRGVGYNFFFTSDKVVVNLRKSKPKEEKGKKEPTCTQVAATPATNSVKPKDCPSEKEVNQITDQGVVLNLNLVGSNPNAQIEGQQELPGKSNYFIGKATNNWQTSITNYARLVYKQVYSGIDVAYYGNQHQLEYDYIVSPGADPGLITFNFDGIDTSQLETTGELTLRSGDAEIRQNTPIIYQEINGTRQSVKGGYVSRGNNKYGFKVEKYDTTKPLIIDPVLTYSTYLGGSSGADLGQNIVVDNNGNVYITGSTLGFGFPTTTGAYSQIYTLGKDVFITKLNSTATALTYSTYLGGSGDDEGLGIAVDSSGNAYVTGYINQPVLFAADFPTTSGAFQTAGGHGQDAFVSKLNSTGSSLVYSTYLGGGNIDIGKGIKVDSTGNAYVTGLAYSSDFPVTTGAYRTAFQNGGTDVFVTKLNTTGTGLVYSTFMGGTGADEGNAIAIDSSGNAYVVGDTTSTNYTVTAGAYKTSLTGGSGQDAFVFKLNASGNSLLYSTYIGSASGTQAELANAIAVDSAGKIYVAGFTLSSNFVTTAGAYQSAYGGSRDGFLLKINPAGSGTSDLQYSTFLGGSGYEEAIGLALDPTTAGIVYVTGMTGSTSFPTTTGAYQRTLGGAWDAFVSKFNTTLNGSASFLYSTMLGGSANDIGRGIALDSTGKVYLVGNTYSTNFPVTSGVYQTSSKGDSDVFVSKLNLTGSGTSDLVYSTFLGGNSYDENNGLFVTSNGDSYVVGTTSSNNFPTTVGSYKTTNSGSDDVVVSKLSPDGSTLLYSTYLGGNGLDTSYGNNIAVDSSGNAYIAGATTSTNFPTTSGAYMTSFQGGAYQASWAADVFVTKLNATGSALIYSTYLGATSIDVARGIAIDSSGNAYVTGTTWSYDFPTTPGSYFSSYSGGAYFQGFLTKFNTTGTGLVYSTYLGGNSDDYAYSVAVDGSGQAYVVGGTWSTNFPTTSGAYQTVNTGSFDAYLTKFNAAGSALLYSTYIGSTNSGSWEFANSVAVDSSGKVYLAGYSTGSGFKTTTGAYQTTSGGSSDAFALKINPAGGGNSDLLYSTLLGGSGNERATAIVLDTNQMAYVVGWTESANFPTTPVSFQTNLRGGTSDAFVVKLDMTQTGSASLPLATYLGGSGNDAAYGVGVDSLGNIYVSGNTTSSDFPTTNGTYQNSNAANYDEFLTKLALANLAFTTQPGGALPTAALNPQPVVTVKNLDGTTRTSFTGPITLTIKSGTGSAGATMAGTKTVNAVSGVATFSGLSINKAGTGYILTASAGSILPTSDSAPFDIVGGPYISAYSGSNQTTAVSTGFNSPLVALVRDGNGNPISGNSVTFTAPASGATGTFAGSSATYVGATNASGLVTTTAFSANGTAGSYTVSAAASGIAVPVNFILNNKPISSKLDMALSLVPPIGGPNVLSSIQTLTATLSSHNIAPVSSQSVTFTIAGSSGTPLTVVKPTNSSGQAVITYTRSTEITDTVSAITTVSGSQLQSNQSTVYWDNSIADGTSTSILGRFYNNSGCYPVRTLSDTPVFSQQFPYIQFNAGGDLSGPYVPFGNRDPIDFSILNAARDGYLAGRGALSNFEAAFTGNIIVTTPGNKTFNFYAGDTYKVGFGSNQNGTASAYVSGGNPGGTTGLNQYPVVDNSTSVSWMGGNAAFRNGIIVNFPEAGIYPFEINYVDCTDQPDSYSRMYMNTPLVANMTISPHTVNGTTGQSVAVTATFKTVAGVAIPNSTVLFNIDGANSNQITATTDVNGNAALVYTGTVPGTDLVQATTAYKGLSFQSTASQILWSGYVITGSGPGGPTGCTVPYAASSLLSSPANRSTQSGLVNVTANTQIFSGTVDFWPVGNPNVPPAASSVRILASGQAVTAGQTLATLDSTLLANGAYVIRLCENGGSSPSASLALINVTGENKPGRIAFSLTDVTVPVAGLPVVIGRTYDSLNRDKMGDFGYGWDLSISSPKLEVNQAGDVTLTTLDGKRTTFYLTPQSPGGFLGYLLQPAYTAEAGVYGTLTQSDCSIIVTAGSSGGYVCFPGGRYDPSTYQYRDAYGRVYTIAKDTSNKFKLTKLNDLSGNTLTFTDGGISSSSLQGDLGQVVQFNRNSTSDPNCPSCIQTVSVINQPGQVFTYTNSTGDLSKVTLPQNMPGSSNPISATYSYYTTADGAGFAHLFKNSVDPRGNTAVTSSYYSDGKLKTVVQPISASLSYTTSYGYDQANNITTITNTDGTISSTQSSQTDSYGKVISQTQQVAAGVYRSTQYIYNTKHQMTSSQVGSAPAITYTYDQFGNQNQVTDQLGHTTTAVYNPYGGPLSITDPVSHTWNVSYDANFLPTVVTDSVGAAGGYNFDARGSILSRSDGNGKSTSFIYDQYGNKIKETDPLGNSTQYAYDNLGRMTFMTDTLSTATKNNYDGLGRLTSTIAAYNTSTPVTTSFTYDANGNILTQTDALNRTTTYTYDNANRLTQTTYPAVGGVTYSTTTTYDWRGNKATETDQAGHQTRYGYNLAGELISTTTGLAANGTTTPDTVSAVYEYDSLGRRSKQYNAYAGAGTLPGGQPYTWYQYDAAGRLITFTNQLNYATIYSYDDAGRKLTEKDANNNTTSFTYDARGRLDKTTYPTLTGGIVISETQSYDGVGNLLSKTDGNGKTTTYSYDEASRLRSVTNPMSQKISYNYTALGQLKTIIDANLHPTGFEYDALGRQTKKIWPDNSYEQYDYDLLGNQNSIRLSDGTTNTFAYDEWYQLKTANFVASGSASARTVNYTYTATGQRYQVTDSSRGVTPVTYGYDNLDRITSITQPGGNVVRYGFDARGNRTAITTTVGSVTSVTTYSYSDANQLSTVAAPTDPGSTHTAYTYDPAGRKSTQNLPNGVLVQYGYDQLNRLLTINQSKSAVPIASYTYTLDKVGNRTGVTEGSGRNITWGYDNAYRLTSEADSIAPGVTTSYSYDAVGNRLNMANSGVTTNYQYNELDQLTTVLNGTTPTLSYSYVRGNLVQVKTISTNTIQQSYSWDSADRLVGATVSSGSATYAYDAEGRRIKQTVGGTTTNYLWDETSLYADVLIESDSNDSIKTSYILGEGELISQKRVGISSPDYHLKDGQDSVRNLTDNLGNLVSGQSYTFDAFGNLTSGQTSPSSTYLYTGQQFDVLTGLYDLRARYYKAGNGRFLSRDTHSIDFKNPIELNRYGYTANNPINFDDPSGYSANTVSYSSILKFVVLGALGVGLVGGIGLAGGAKVNEYLTYVTAALSLATARELYKTATKAVELAAMKVVYNFTIVVAEPLFLDGHRETFITVSNYFTQSWGKIFGKIIDALKPSGSVSGGRFQSSNASHAEILMVNRLKNTSNLNWPQGIPGSVSGQICVECQKMARDTSTPGQSTGYSIYDIDTIKGITLVLFAPGLKMA